MNPMMYSHVYMNAVHTTRDGTSPEELAAFDLNLLVAFDALARERNVTAAARRIGVTQSAMSHALRRLRTLLGDPVFVRGPNGMLLSARAESLVVPLRSGLVTLGRALAQPAAFDPETARRAFRIASPDLFDVLVIPHVLERMRELAPGVDLAVTPIQGPRLRDQLATGELDVAVLPQLQGTPARGDADLVRRVMFHDTFSCFVRADHPRLGARGRGKRKQQAVLPLDAYVELSHMLVSARRDGTDFVDEALAKQGKQRRIALRIPHFYAALAIVARSDLVLTAPTSLARLPPGPAAVTTLAVPVRLPAHAVPVGLARTLQSRSGACVAARSADVHEPSDRTRDAELKTDACEQQHLHMAADARTEHQVEACVDGDEQEVELIEQGAERERDRDPRCHVEAVARAALTAGDEAGAFGQRGHGWAHTITLHHAERETRLNQHRREIDHVAAFRGHQPRGQRDLPGRELGGASDVEEGARADAPLVVQAVLAAQAEAETQRVRSTQRVVEGGAGADRRAEVPGALHRSRRVACSWWRRWKNGRPSHASSWWRRCGRR